MSVSNLMPESASRTERKRIRNRDALVAAARGLFVRDGFEATTIADITASADLGFGTFYRYFADKEAALEAVLDDGRRQIDAVLLAPEIDGVSAADALVHLSRRFVVAIRRNRDVLTLMWQVAMRKTVGRRPLSIEALGPEQSLPVVLAAAIERIISRGIAAREFAGGDSAMLSRLIAGAHMYLLSPAAHDADEGLVTSTLCDFELRALGATPARPALKPVDERVRRKAVGGH